MHGHAIGALGPSDSSFFVLWGIAVRGDGTPTAVLGVTAARTPDKTRRLRGVILDSDGEFERGTNVRRGQSQVYGVSVFPLVLNNKQEFTFFFCTVI
jgi:hypothetical protein